MSEAPAAGVAQDHAGSCDDDDELDADAEFERRAGPDFLAGRELDHLW